MELHSISLKWNIVRIRVGIRQLFSEVLREMGCTTLANVVDGFIENR